MSNQLKALAKVIRNGKPITHDHVRHLVGSTAATAKLHSGDLREVFRDDSIIVRRAVSGEEDSQESAPLAQGINRLIAGFSGTEQIRTHIKVVRVSSDVRSPQCTAFFEAFAPTATGSLQQTSEWTVTWSVSDPRQPPLFRSIVASKFEEAELKSNSPTLFSERTHEVLGAEPVFHQQLSRGTGYWLRRLESYLSPRLLESHIGFALGDINSDGLDDLYVCQPGGLPNRLLVQQADGTLVDQSRRAGVDILDWTTSALIVDLDNDSHQDLAMVANGDVLVFAGDGMGQFSLQTRIRGSYEYSLTAADFDNDSDLDLYACNFFAAGTAVGLAQLRRTDPLYDSNKGGRNALFRNDGEAGFVDVTDEVGLNDRNQRFSLAAAWEDFDNDGDVDLYVANDYGHNNLYRNDRGRFTDVAVDFGAVDANFGMSVSWGDVDRDGWMDLYISNMFSAAGNRVTSQPKFMPGLDVDRRRQYQILARGNTLLQNKGGHAFRDVSVDAGVTMGRWAWGSLFADINNDGWEDLLVSNGYLTQDSQDDL